MLVVFGRLALSQPFVKTVAHDDFTIVAKLCRTASRDNVGLYIVALIVKWMGSLVSQGVLCWVSWHIGSNGPFQPVHCAVHQRCRHSSSSYVSLYSCPSVFTFTGYTFQVLPRGSDRTEGYTLTRTPLHESRRQNDPVKRTSC